MDQLKVALAVVQKHYFWISSVVVTLLFIGVWFLVTSDLQSTTERQKQTIESQWTSVRNIQTQLPLPNQYSHDKMDEIVQQLAQELARAWQKQYEQQRAVLVWPEELTDEFIAAVDPLRPIEKAVPYNPEATPPIDPRHEIAPRFRELYHNYARDLLPKLAETIGAEWQATRTTGGSGRADSGESGGARQTPRAATQQVESIVYWSPQNQSALLSAHFNWAQTPNTVEVLYAQETLWVLEEILRIIARTNGDIEARYQAAIKDVDEILLGRPALGRRGQITRSRPSGQYESGDGEGAMATMDDGGGSSGEGGSGEGGSGEGGDGSRASASRDPAEGRYVDGMYNLLPAQTLRSAVASDDRDPSNASVAVAKRMPVRIRLKMDQRKLSQLLAECGNAKLPLEVRQVRINRTAGGGSRAATGSTPRLGFSGGGEDEGFSFGESSPRSQAPRTVTSTSPYDVPIEIYGIVYLYNPVHIEKLGIDQIDKDTLPADAAKPAGEPVDDDVDQAAAANNVDGDVGG